MAKESSVNRKEMVKEKCLECQKGKNNINMGKNRSKCKRLSYFSWVFKSYLMIESKLYNLMWCSMYEEEILKIYFLNGEGKKHKGN